MSIVNEKMTMTPTGDVAILVKSNVTVAQTGTVAEAAGNFVTYTLPGGLMGANDSLEIYALATRPAGDSGNVQITVRFNGISGTIYLNNTMATTALIAQHKVIIHNNNSTSAQKAFPNTAEEETYRESTTAMVTSSVDTSADVDIQINAIIGTAADSLDLESYYIKLIRA